MSLNSPITNYIVEPFNKNIIKKHINFNNHLFIQISVLLLILSIYYLFEDQKNRSSLLYILSYFFFYKFSNLLNKKSDIKLIYDITYLLINVFLVIYVSYEKKYTPGTTIFLYLIIILTLISFALKINKFKSKNKKLNKVKNFLIKSCKKIYPDNGTTKKYHMQNFWNIFDFSTFSFIILLVINN